MSSPSSMSQDLRASSVPPYSAISEIGSNMRDSGFGTSKAVHELAE